MSRKICISAVDQERLLKLIKEEREFGSIKNQDYLRDLERELNRAEVLEPSQIPSDIITMNSKICLKDLETGEETIYSLVYPEDADLLEDKISILAPVGTAMLGYQVGDIIDWQVPDGVIQFKVEKIIYQPEAAGDYEL
ncbi:MAG: nucleoside diphosphate kinase regulator [Desulfitobacterium sp.]|nr:nucleoside diphosphate kinase regulator [Desulfitobacterium sp.]